MKSNIKSILMLVSLVLVIVFAVSVFSTRSQSKDEFTYGEMKELFSQNLVISLKIDFQKRIFIFTYLKGQLQKTAQAQVLQWQLQFYQHLLTNL